MLSFLYFPVTEFNTVNRIRSLAREVAHLRRMVLELQLQRQQSRHPQVSPTTLRNVDVIGTSSNPVVLEEKRGFECIHKCMGGKRSIPTKRLNSFLKCKGMCRR